MTVRIAQFVPKTANFTDIVGALINTACGLLGQSGASCNDIAGNGTTGVYGRVSGCDPSKFCLHFCVEHDIDKIHSRQIIVRHEPVLRTEQPQCTVLRLLWQRDCKPARLQIELCRRSGRYVLCSKSLGNIHTDGHCRSRHW